MTQDDEHEDDGGGFDVDDWSRLHAFRGAVATLDDVQAGRAVFARPVGHLIMPFE